MSISQSMPIIGAKPEMLLVSAVALIDVDGRVLLSQRPANKSMAGLWEFPGGKVRLKRRSCTNPRIA